MRVYILAFILSLIFSSFKSFAVEGYVITQQIQTSMMGGGLIKKQKVYITENFLITADDNGEVIQSIENGKFKIMRYDKISKRYIDMTKMAPMIFTSLPFFSCTPAGCEMRKNVFRPTDEYKMFGKYKARKILTTVSMFGIASNIANWYTKDYKELVEAEKLRAKFFIKAISAIKKEGTIKAFNVNTDELKKLFNKITNQYGGLIASQSNLMGGKSFMRVISVEKKDIDLSDLRN